MSKVERHPQGNPDPLAEMVTLMQEQAICIQELERNMSEYGMMMRSDIVNVIANIVGAKTAMSPDNIESVATVWNPNVETTPNIRMLTALEGNLGSSMCAITWSALSLYLLKEGVQIDNQVATQNDTRTSRRGHEMPFSD